jgi:hypothetical protein
MQEGTEMSKRVIGTIGMIGAAGALAVVVLGAHLSHLDQRIGLRNSIYAAIATALLAAVMVDAIHHRLADERGNDAVATPLTAWSSIDADDDTGHVLTELRLAARLGAELVGEAPASRSRRDPAPIA